MAELAALLGLDGAALTDENNAVCYEVYDAAGGGAHLCCTLHFCNVLSMLCLGAFVLSCRRCRRGCAGSVH